RNAGFTHAAWLLTDDVRPVENGNQPPPLWQGLSFAHSGPPGGVAGAPWRPRGLRVLLSDLLWQGGPLAGGRPPAGGAGAAAVVQVRAQADVEPPEGQALRLVDVESGAEREIHVDADAARRYREALARHRENWHLACRQAGAAFSGVVAEKVLRDWELT